jgi:hypothetical protein
VTLIAPLASLDRSRPLLDLERVRIPVYQEKKYLLSDIISETSPYTFSLDPDTTIDTSGNGVYEDDYTTSASGVRISATGLTLGAYDSLGTRVMQAQVADSYGNITDSPLEVEVYAPLPEITSVIGSTLSGYLREELLSEPIHIFRVRQGDGITLIDPKASMTDAR